MIPTDQLAQWVEPWNRLFSHSKLVAGTVTGAHIIALMFGGGLAIAADRMTLRVERGNAGARAVQLRDVRAVHAPVLGGLIVLFISGVLLVFADVDTFVNSPLLWIKLGLVTLLLINGAVLTVTERRLGGLADLGGTEAESVWSRMRVLAWLSVFLWTATAVAGIVLSNAS